ncbi:MAG: hypothetical protein JOZ77_08955 [Candidatus Eremiobacteraeota bacterium]|nr:hypothetical protein [Candidatus Eremiobacteraeota bacterium]
MADPTSEPSFSGHIDIFSLHGSKYALVGQIEDDNSPQGMTTDREGNLYVCDIGVATEGPAAGDIKIYPKGSTSYSRLIVPGKWVPFDVAVKNDGTMYVANIAPVASFYPGSVSVFPPLAIQPSRTLKFPNSQVLGITRHAATATVYVSYSAKTSSSQGRIAEFKNARGKAIDLGVSYAFPWGILEDGSDNLLAFGGNGFINVYSEATRGLVKQIPIPNAAMFGAFNEARSRLFVSNFEQVEVLSYPSGSVVGTVNDGWSKSNYPTGVAFWPPPP